MRDPRKALRTAYISALSGLTYNGDPVTVYDKVPQSAIYPYVEIAEQTSVDGSDKSSYGQEVTVLLNVVTGFEPGIGGSSPSDDIANSILSTIYIRGQEKTVLDLSGDNFSVTTTALDSDTPLKELDENYHFYRRLLRFRHRIEQTDETI